MCRKREPGPRAVTCGVRDRSCGADRSTSERIMQVNIYVGNLPFNTANADLERLFGEYGTVDSAAVITDRETGRSRGFGFVEMTSSDEARKAIEELNGTDMGGRALTVNEARPRR